MLESMSSSQLSRWMAYFQNAAYFGMGGEGWRGLAMERADSIRPNGAPAPQRAPAPRVGTGRLRLEDWQAMDETQQKTASKDLYDVFKAWATVSQ